MLASVDHYLLALTNQGILAAVSLVRQAVSIKTRGGRISANSACLDTLGFHAVVAHTLHVRTANRTMGRWLAATSRTGANATVVKVGPGKTATCSRPRQRHGLDRNSVRLGLVVLSCLASASCGIPSRVLYHCMHSLAGSVPLRALRVWHVVQEGVALCACLLYSRPCLHKPIQKVR